MHKTLQAASLFLLMAVVVVRPMLTESYDAAQSSFSIALQGTSDPSPVRTLLFDILILIAAAGWMLSRVVAPHGLRYRKTGLEWGLLLLIVAAIVSSLHAGNSRLAINASLDWLCLPILAITLTQLATEPRHRRVLLAALAGTASVWMFTSFEQVLWGFDETWEHYQQTRESFWAQQGVELDAPEVALFEGRMKARQASGLSAHSNIAGSFLMLITFVAAALAILRWRRRRPGDALDLFLAAMAFLLTAGLLLTTWLTGSRGALIGAAAATLVVLLLCAIRRRWNVLPATQWLTAWLFVAAGGAVVMGYGLARESLPGVSLTFRWQYWQASADMIVDHPLTGVGRENFGRHYVRYKSIESPEEVANPHNLLVHGAAEWGLPGAAGLMALLLGGSWSLGARPRRAPPDDPTTLAERDRGWIWLLPLVAVAVAGRLWGLGTDNPFALYYVGATTAIFFALGAIAFLLPQRATDSAGRGDATMWHFIGAGLLAFLIYEMINFALFVPATATVFFALLGLLLAQRLPIERQTRDNPRRLWSIAFAAWAALIGLVLVTVALPVIRADRALHQARHALATLPPTADFDAHPAAIHFRWAAELDHRDPTPHVEHARWLGGIAADPQARRLIPNDAQRLALIDRALERVRMARVRDPHQVGLARMLTRLWRMRAETSRDPANLEKAVEAARQALALYPLDPPGLITLADTLVELADLIDDAATWVEAGMVYRQALDLDDARLSWESLRRFPARQKAEIESRIEHCLRRAGRAPL